jgi:hypothetical protein
MMPAPGVRFLRAKQDRSRPLVRGGGGRSAGAGAGRRCCC